MKSAAAALLAVVVAVPYLVHAGSARIGSPTGTDPGPPVGKPALRVQEVAIPEVDPGTLAVAIVASPRALVLASSGSGDSFTVHADVAFASVAATSVRMDGLLPTAVFPDDRGDLVVKLALTEVKALATPPVLEIVLDGALLDGTPFRGVTSVRVK